MQFLHVFNYFVTSALIRFFFFLLKNTCRYHQWKTLGRSSILTLRKLKEILMFACLFSLVLGPAILTLQLIAIY